MSEESTGGVEVDVEKVRGVFAELERELKAEGEGGALAAEFRRDPLAVLRRRGVGLGAAEGDAQVETMLADRLRSTDLAAFPAGGAPAARADALGSFWGCWACVKATETAISIGAGAALGLMFAGGAIAVAAIATVSAVAAAILGVSLAAAQQIVTAILSKVSDPGAFVEQLAKDACKGPCS